MRRLLSIRRSVPRHLKADYDALWARLERSADEHGFHAWRFHAASTENSYIEFLEFRDDLDPRADADLSVLLDELKTRLGLALPPQVAEEEWWPADSDNR